MLGFLPKLPSSKQLYHLNLDGGVCQLFPAHSELSELIDYYWLLSITSPELVLEVIPDTAIDLVLCPEDSSFAALYFPSTDIQRIPLQGPINFVGVCFRSAAARAFFQSEITDLRALDIGANTIEQLGIKELVTEVNGTRNIERLRDGFDHFWLNRLGHVKDFSTTLDPTVLIKLLGNSLEGESMASICSVFGVSERHFRRLSNDMFGFSPKKIQKILRLQAALTELFQCEKQQLQDLYYDDSHRIRELKKLTGFTPHQIRQMAEKYNQT